MKTILTTAAAISLFTAPALADEAKPNAGQGCSETGIHLLQEDVNGDNCPATAAEHSLGEFIVFLVGSALILEAAGVDVAAEIAAIHP